MRFGMFGDDVGFRSASFEELSEEARAKVDEKVKQLL